MARMTVGSLFAGVMDGPGIAAEWHFDASLSWQLDLVGEEVRAQRFPDALQVTQSIVDTEPDDLPAVDVLTGGFPCQDLSCAGTGSGLKGARSGLYFHLLRFAGAKRVEFADDDERMRWFEEGCPIERDLGRRWLPQFVLIENVPGLLKYMGLLVEHFRDLGYGLSWVKCMALDAGAPHRRARVFVLAERGVLGRGEVQVDIGGRWSPVESEREWGTPVAKMGGSGRRGGDRGHEELLGAQVQTREWPSPMSADGARGSTQYARGNPTLVGAASQVVDEAGVRHWATPNAANVNEGEGLDSFRRRSAALVAKGSRPLSEPLALQVPMQPGARPWPSPTAGDAKASGSRNLGSNANPGTSLTDAVRPDRVTVEEAREWATPRSTDAQSPGRRLRGRDSTDYCLSVQVREWPTPQARDFKTGDTPNRKGTEALSAAGGAERLGLFGRRLNPEWVETLMGMPQRWTDPTVQGPLEVLRTPRWPRGRYPAGWDRSVYWPGFAWEPLRTLPDGPPCPGRPARLRGLGNGALPQHVFLALRALFGEANVQPTLFGGLAR